VISVGILLLGRAVLGVAESFIVTGALSWGLALMGPQNTGKVMSWVGTSLYAAFAVGAPAGTALYTGYGFAAIALGATLIPLVALPLVASMRPTSATSHTSAGLIKVAVAVWLPGLGLALSGVGFGAIITFIGLFFAQRGWTPPWVAFTALSVAFIAGRAFRPSAGPDRRREGRVGVHPDRSGGLGADLVSAIVRSGFGRRYPKRPRLFAGLSRTWRRGDPPRAAAEPRSRDGRLYGLSRSLLGPCQSGAWTYRRQGIGFGLSRQHAGRA